jgi:hypothetical protein
VSCGLRDVMEFETLGRPAVLAASNAFVQAADEQSVLLGQPELRRVMVPHPIQDRSDDELRALARDAVQALLAAVTAAPPANTVAR